MLFRVVQTAESLRSPDWPSAWLITDERPDSTQYLTRFELVVIDRAGESVEIGTVKIGQFGMSPDQKRPALEADFEKLGQDFFSLGQDATYYENLNGLGPELRSEILVGLRDVAADLDLFERALPQKVMKASLLSSVPPGAVRGQFHRMTQGAARLTRYEFSFIAPQSAEGIQPPVVSITVEPESRPPTNIHVLIGRNGVGKTRLLNAMVKILSGHSNPSPQNGRFESPEVDSSDALFASVVSVSFSAFDPFGPLRSREYERSGERYTYIGLKQVPHADYIPAAPKTLVALRDEFTRAVGNCLDAGRRQRWQKALATLEADPLFRDAGISSLAFDEDESISILDDGDEVMTVTGWEGSPVARPWESLNEQPNWARDSGEIFMSLSAGHKIVLLTLAELVSSVEARTLVLVDEPEAHLHPPLLSAFVRALSDLVIHQNGVAILATHSPVVLQEVPRSCVWKLRRNGRASYAERPDTETFGENVGVLTREVFGLEVTQSGFHKMLREAVRSGGSFDEIVRSFNGQLGDEARAILQVLVALRDSRQWGQR